MTVSGMVSIHWNWLINPRTWFCVFWLSIKCIVGSKTPDLCKNIIFKNQLLFNFNSSKNRITINCFLSGACTDHRTWSSCPTLAVSAAVYWLLLRNFVLRSLQIVLTLRWWRKGLFIEVEEKLIFEYDIFAKIWCLWPPYAFYWQSKDTDSYPGIY